MLVICTDGHRYDGPRCYNDAHFCVSCDHLDELHHNKVGGCMETVKDESRKLRGGSYGHEHGCRCTRFYPRAKERAIVCARCKRTEMRSAYGKMPEYCLDCSALMQQDYAKRRRKA